MSIIKNYDITFYNSAYDAVSYFVKENEQAGYGFPVCSHEGFEQVLYFLCVNNIEHNYTITPFNDTIGLISVNWSNNEATPEHYNFWGLLPKEENDSM
jgi:hypothetical protein